MNTLIYSHISSDTHYPITSKTTGYWITIVKRKENTISHINKHDLTYCHDILFKRAIENKAKIEASEKLRIVVQPPKKKRVRVNKKIASTLNKLEQQLGIEQTIVTKLQPHIFLFEGDMKWFSNALAFSVWISIIRNVIKYPQDRDWKRSLLKRSYFERVESLENLNKFFDLLPKLFDTKFTMWRGDNNFDAPGIHTFLCRNRIVVHTNPNSIHVWVLKKLWNIDVSET